MKCMVTGSLITDRQDIELNKKISLMMNDNPKLRDCYNQYLMKNNLQPVDFEKAILLNEPINVCLSTDCLVQALGITEASTKNINVPQTAEKT